MHFLTTYSTVVANCVRKFIFTNDLVEYVIIKKAPHKNEVNSKLVTTKLLIYGGSVIDDFT